MIKRLLLSLALLPCLSFAGPGHDHGHDEGPTVTDPNSPQRNPDGSVFLPKQTQRFMRLRTVVSEYQVLPRSLVLYGRIVAGSNAGSKVQALQAGRLSIPNEFLPIVGNRVEKGQLLAKITLAQDAQENTLQEAEIADLREQLKLAQMEKERLAKLAGAVAQRKIDAATSKVSGLRARIRALGKGAKGKTDNVYAQTSGIVTGSYASNGQAVQAGDLLLELIDPAKLQVEAVTFDPSLPSNIDQAGFSIGTQRIALRYQGRSPQLRQQALPLRFAIPLVADDDESVEEKAERLGLVAGLPVQITVQTREKIKGVAVPAKSLVRNSSNQTTVWVKLAPEHYESRVVRFQPLDAEHVSITDGLNDGERVVIHAANLLNQIR